MLIDVILVAKIGGVCERLLTYEYNEQSTAGEQKLSAFHTIVTYASAKISRRIEINNCYYTYK